MAGSSCPVNLLTLPSAALDAVLAPENVRLRSSGNSVAPLSFPKSRSALWDSSPSGEELHLQFCPNRKPRLVLLEKALRLAQRHARHCNKPRLHCFFLGSVSVDADEEGITVTLDRFDPGRDQAGASGRVPSALLPGDVLVPCLFSTPAETQHDAVVQSEAELHHCFKVLQQCVSGRQTLDLSQLVKIKGHVVCSQQSDAAAFSLSWTCVCPSVSVDVQPVRAVPVIPTALLRSLTSISRPHSSSRQRGFLTMDQTRKLLLLLESDPKASNLPLVGIWLSGVTHVSSPQVWAWCLRFLFSSTLQDRVFSESRCFLLVLFSATHRAPQFFQCRGPGPQLDLQLLTASQHVTLYQQVLSVEGQTVRCELSTEEHSRQMEVFREAQSSFNSAAPAAAAGLSVSDQDSGVEDEDLSPRPSPSPHPPAQQARRVQPSVPELSLLIDSSFTSNQRAPPPPAAANRMPVPPTESTSSSSLPRPPTPHLHSTPNSNLQQPCACCHPHPYDCTSILSPALHTPPAHSQHKTPPPSLHPAPLPPLAHSYHHTPPRPSSRSPALHPASPLSSSLHHAPPPPPAHSHHQTPPAHSHHQTPPAHSHHQTPPPPSSRHRTPPPSSLQTPPPPSCLHPTPPPSSRHPTPPPSSLRSTSPPSSLNPAPPPPPAHHQTPPPPSSRHPTPPPSSCHPIPPPSSLHATPPPSSRHPTPPPSSLHPTPPPSSRHPTPPPPSSLNTAPPPPPVHSQHHTPHPPPPVHLHHHTPSSNHPGGPSVPPPSIRVHLSSLHHTPPSFSSRPPAPSAPPSHHHTAPSSLLPSPPCPCSHSPGELWCADSPSPHPSCPAAGAPPAPPPRFPHPPLVNQCYDQVGGVVPTDTYQLLLHQDRQLRLLQAQVQMLLEAQGKLQVETQTPRSTSSIAVGTGDSLFWGVPDQLARPEEEQAPLPSIPSPPSSSPGRAPSHADLSVSRLVGGAEDGDTTGQGAAMAFTSQHSPVLGESVSMYRAADDQQSFYHNLMTQLNSRLQESDNTQVDVEEEEEQEEAPETPETRRSLPVPVTDGSPSSQSSQSSQSSSHPRRKQQNSGDTVLSATLQQLQKLGVDMNTEALSESDRRVQQAVQSSSTLARINPAAVLSRLSVSEPTDSSVFPRGSVDLSLEANAIALRYLSDSQLNRLSVGGRAPAQDSSISSKDSLLSPSNMSMATRKYMRRYGLIEEEDEEEEEEDEVAAASTHKPLTTEAQNVKLLPQSQLIRDLRPKMQLLASSTKLKTANKENCPSRRPSLVRESIHQPEGSVGNILDLSRLRQLPKLF